MTAAARHTTATRLAPLPKLIKCVVTIAFPDEGKTMHIEFGDEATARRMVALFVRMSGGAARGWATAPRYDDKAVTWQCSGDDGCLLDG